MMSEILWVIFLLLQATSFSENLDEKQPAKDGELKDMPGYMLPTSLSPEHQLVRLQPFFNGNSSVHGYTEITFEVLSPTSNITLHMVAIETINSTISVEEVGSPGSSLPIISNTYDPETEFFRCNLASVLRVGSRYTISMEFLGVISGDLLGLYSTSYTNTQGDTVALAVTQFAPVEARKAFPCFDEPAFKSTFDIELIREDGMVAYSNMPLERTDLIVDQPGWRLDTFQTSVKMSTYLVAFLISDFASKSSNGSVLFRVLARSESIDHADYALNIGPQILSFFETFYGIEFPLPKMDMAAIPDFYYGAMENWGLITYRETAMLYDDELSSALDKQGICAVVAHELAHQWFGNLVTFEWWNDVWLNEGFARFMQYPGCDSVEPSFGINDQFIVNDLHYILEIDSFESSHPLNNEIDHPDDLNHIYDSIAYSKGGSLLRMIEFFLTPPTLQNGLTKYLTNFSYSNAKSDDLWEFLTTEGHNDGTLDAGLTVKTIMDTWVLQTGYPVINATLNGDGTALLTQERFLLEENPNSNDTHDYKWWIPVSFASQSNPDFSQYSYQWMADDEPQKVITGLPATSEWVIFNIQQAGYYRVNYDLSNWVAISQQLSDDNSIIDKLNRAQILDDSFNLARAGKLGYDVAMELTSYLGDDLNYVPIKTGLNKLDYIFRMFMDQADYGALVNYMESIVIPQYDRIGFDDSLLGPHQLQLSRSTVMDWARKLEYEPCLTNSTNLYSQWMADPDNYTIISPNVKNTVYCAAVAEGGIPEWDFAYDRYLNSSIAAEKEKLLNSMGCSRNQVLLSNYLDMAFTNSSGIAMQDVSTVISSVSSNLAGEELAWDYITTNDDAIAAYMGSYQSVAEFVEIASRRFNEADELLKLNQFKNDNSAELGQNTQSVDQAIEGTQNNIEWMRKYYDFIANYLNDNGYNVTATA